MTRQTTPLIAALLFGVSLTLAPAAMAQTTPTATAITEVDGTGQKLTALALDYATPISSAALSPADFSVPGRTILRAYANTTAAKATQGSDGPFVILELSPDDADAALFRQVKRDTIRKQATATVTQTAPITTASGQSLPAGTAIATSAVKNLIVDDFQAFRFTDPATGKTLAYNLYTPKDYDPAQSYPLVLFMHDAGTTSDIVNTTLVQGLGAVVWASPAEQAKHPAFVLAPQFAEMLVNDQSEASPLLDTTVDLIRDLGTRYSIDQNRLYTTGQSGGAMGSIALDIKYPDLFAASFLVAGQWDPALVAPLAQDNLFIIVSQGDEKAYPGQNAITAALEKQGAQVARAVWQGTATPDQFAAGVTAILAQGAAINYVALEKGTVVPQGQEDSPGANHVNTWRIAYTIEGVRDWLFAQSR